MKNIKQLFLNRQNKGLFVLSEIVAKGLNWLMGILLPLFLTVEEYGEIGLFIAINGYLSFFILAGSDKYIFKYFLKEKPNYYGEVLLISFLQLILGIVVLKLLGIKEWIIYIFCFAIFLQVNIRHFTSIQRLNSQGKKYALARLGFAVLSIVLVLSLSYWGRESRYYVYGILIAAATIWFWTIPKFITNNEIQLDIKRLKVIVVFTLPFIIHGILKSSIQFADRFIIDNMLSRQELGIYSLHYSLTSSISFIFIALNIVFEVDIIRSEKYQTFLAKFIYYGLMLSLAVSIIILYVSPYILSNFFDERYQAHEWMLFVLLCGFAFNLYYIVFTSLFVRFSLTKYIPIVTFIGAAFNIGCNFLFIQEYGIEAVPYVNVATYMLISLIGFILNFKYLSRNSIYIYISLLLVFIIALVFRIEFVFILLFLFTILLRKKFKT